MDLRLPDRIKNIICSPMLFASAFMVFFELGFHLMRFGCTGGGLGFKLLFGVFYGTIFGLICSLLPRLGMIIVFMTGMLITTVYFIAQIIYSGVFNTYLSISGTFHVAGQALDYTDVIANELAREWWKVAVLLVPFVFFVVKGRKLIVKPVSKLKSLLAGVIVLLVTGVILSLSVYSTKSKLYSPYSMVKSYTSVDMSVKTLGVTETFWLDTVSGIKGAMGKDTGEVSFVEETPVVEEEKAEADVHIDISALGKKIVSMAHGIDTSPNVLDIDMDELIEAESNSNVKAIHEYVKNTEPTLKNKYTGMFEGYNVIFVVAEGFSGYVIDKELTPTLYKLQTEGFYFKNYYTPLWYGSTLGGEYADLTGLMPKNGGYLSMEKAGANKNDMRFTLSAQLKALGYKVTGYHANYYDYYDRNVSHPNMGMEWIGVGSGYEPEYSDYGVMLWPQSDLRLVENTVADYIKQEPFYTYYLTVSGHVMYNFGGNAMSARHRDYVENLLYSETTKAYIACQYELELAMTKLVEELEEAGAADNTLIVLTADHVPYNDKVVVDELAGKQLDNTFEWYKNALIIWSASMREPVVVDKYCSSIDILPTVSNLMGLEYDSRMLVGQDIMSDSEGLVMFNDRSFITDKLYYNANTNTAAYFNGREVASDELERLKAMVSNKFNMAQAICDYNYYRYITEYLESE